MGGAESAAKTFANACGCSKISTNEVDCNTMGKNRKHQYRNKIVNLHQTSTSFDSQYDNKEGIDESSSSDIIFDLDDEQVATTK